uniref:HEPN domain-containing protein n=1 Tax=Ignisphaera aggregans TaxID=334771 RepID=A0A7C5UTY4_9CREN
MFIALSRGIEERLIEEARKSGASVEELIVEILSKALNKPLDPEERVEIHLKLAEKYFREAEELLIKKDYVQASEKAWGAAAQIVKALAAKEGKELRSHASLWEYVDELAEKLHDIEVRHLWGRANNLHQNFYENWMPPRDVVLAIEDVKKFVEKLKKLL